MQNASRFLELLILVRAEHPALSAGLVHGVEAANVELEALATVQQLVPINSQMNELSNRNGNF